MTTEMSPRERVTRAVEFTGPDRIPVHRYIFPGAFFRHGQNLVDFLNRQPDDFGVGPVSIPPEPPDTFEEYRDEWGSLWVRLKGYTTGEVREPALPAWDRYTSYALPHPPAEQTFNHLAERIKKTGHRYYVMGAGGHIFERLQFIRGTQNLFVDLAENRAELHDLADRVVDYHLQIIHAALRAGADALSFGDDWGSQRSLLISPESWRAFFKPRYRKLFEPVLNAGAHIWFHTDGWTLEILDDLLELGVNVLNPQHHCMGNRTVAEKIAGRACLRSDLDRQHIIPHGTRDEIETHVREIIALFGSHNGGLILHGEIGPEVPFTNIRHLYESFTRYGTYPLTWLPTQHP